MAKSTSLHLNKSAFVANVKEYLSFWRCGWRRKEDLIYCLRNNNFVEPRVFEWFFYIDYLEVKPCFYPSFLQDGPLTVMELEHGLHWLIGVLFMIYQLVWRTIDFFPLKCRLPQVKTFDEGCLGIFHTLAQDAAKEHLPFSKISKARARRSGSFGGSKMGTLEM